VINITVAQALQPGNSSNALEVRPSGLKVKLGTCDEEDAGLRRLHSPHRSASVRGAARRWRADNLPHGTILIQPFSAPQALESLSGQGIKIDAPAVGLVSVSHLLDRLRRVNLSLVFVDALDAVGARHLVLRLRPFTTLSAWGHTLGTPCLGLHDFRPAERASRDGQGRRRRCRDRDAGSVG
jgi:hypothetical protein